MISIQDLTEAIEKEPRVQITCPALGIDEERIVVEGDRALHPDDVTAYALERLEIAQELVDEPNTNKQGLLGRTKDGKLVRWARGKRLTYAVLKNSFDSDAEYDDVVKAMTIATGGWMAQCGVTFDHLAEKDTQQTITTDEVLFRVVGGTASGGLVAKAFFPDEDDPTEAFNRTVLVFNGFFADQKIFNPIGVIRHELGHVLGFRHEHIRPEAPDTFRKESLVNAHELSDYDPKSVMHYLHPTDPDFGDPELEFTEEDRTGSQAVYGAPDIGFFFVP